MDLVVQEDCVQMIENLLKEYYIDTKFLELLKKEKLKYKPENGQSIIQMKMILKKIMKLNGFKIMK